MGEHIVAAGVAVDFFGDAARLHRDIQADAAEKIIRRKFAKEPDVER